HLYGSIAWLGMICFGLQIYFDFAGYSLMAIGLGMMFGFHLPTNFNHPYIAQSIAEFWRRWHMTLSAWFRDYVYIPLGGNRRGSARTYFNLLTVFVLCGLWHGAAWNFLAWGLCHGACLILERGAFGRALARARRPARHLYVLLVVFGAWVLFRADGFDHAANYYAALFGGADGDPRRNPIEAYLHAELWLALALGAVMATPLPARAAAWIGRQLTARGGAGALVADSARIGGLLVVFVVASAYVAGGAYNPFIYFRF
ncbi:MAG: MBOAT family protein, partial [Alphaproteobacteria bacterium]